MPTPSARDVSLICALAVLDCGGVSPATQAPQAPAAARSAFSAGLTTFTFVDAARQRPLPTRIWYPAATESAERDIVLEGIFQGRAAVGAPITSATRRFPLVLLSHGTGGGSSNLTWLAEHLARQGYIVAAVEHHGDTFQNHSVEGLVAVWRRPRDLSQVLDALLGDPRFRERIDPQRVGMAPAVGQGFDGEGLASISIPVRIVAGVDDEVVPIARNARHYAALIPGARLTELTHGGHFVFMAPCNNLGRRVAPAVCNDLDPAVARSLVHRQVGDEAVAFFDRELAGADR